MKLTKSQRINGIQDIAARLEDEEWTDVDLVLKQFGLPVSDQWSGTKHEYVVSMIESAKDSDLVELAEHFGMSVSKTSTATPQPETPYWEEGKLKVFISHLSSKRKQAAKLQSALSPYGMSSFVAHNDIHPTSEWQIEIETALSTCDLLVALINPKFKESSWCDQEIGYALGRGVPVFTVRLGADPYGFVSRFQAFNGSDKSESSIGSELFEAAILHKQLQDQMASILVDQFINSGSFSTAKSRISYLEKLNVWEESYSKRLEKAVESNSQIKGSWGVAGQVKSLVKKWS